MIEQDPASAGGAVPVRRGLRGAIRNPLASSFLARGMTLVPTAVAALAATRLLNQHYDLDVFNAYVLVGSAMALLPLNSLGVGSAVTNAFAGAGPDSDEAAGVTLTAARIMTLSMLVLLSACLVITVLGQWPAIVGPGASSGGFGLAIAVWALGFVPGLGTSILLGTHRNHLSLLVTGLTAPIAVVGLGIVIALDAPASVAIMLPALAVVVVNLGLAGLSARTAGVRWGALLARIPRRRAFPGRPIRHMAGPALIVSLAVPITLHGDRLILSHVGTENDLASYSVVFQIFGPVGALLAASSQPLWPLYERERAQGIPAPNLWKTMALFFALAAAIGAALVAIAGPVAPILSDDKVDLGFGVPAAMALFTLAGAVALPLSMKMMEPRGLRVAATCCAIALPLNVGLSILLADRIGAPGPLLASVAVGLVVQVLPGLVYVRRRDAERHPRPAAT